MYFFNQFPLSLCSATHKNNTNKILSPHKRVTFLRACFCIHCEWHLDSLQWPCTGPESQTESHSVPLPAVDQDKKNFLASKIFHKDNTRSGSVSCRYNSVVVFLPVGALCPIHWVSDTQSLVHNSAWLIPLYDLVNLRLHPKLAEGRGDAPSFLWNNSYSQKTWKICFSIYKMWWEIFHPDFNNILLYWTENTSVYTSPVRPIQILPYLARSIENEAIIYI